MPEDVALVVPQASHPDPEHRRKPGADGTPITLADGREWLLHDGGVANSLDPIRDRMFDKSVLERSVLKMDVYVAATVMLQANYRLDDGEARDLLIGADEPALIEAVFEAMFGPVEAPRTYSAWVRAMLLGNGLDPARIPARDRGNVLDMLVRTGRAIPCGVFCDAAEASRQIDGWLARAGIPTDAG